MIHPDSLRRRWVHRSVAFTLLAGVSGAAGAQQSLALDRFDLSLGGYHGRTDTSISANTPMTNSVVTPTWKTIWASESTRPCRACD